MSLVLIREPISEPELALLLREFPFVRFDILNPADPMERIEELWPDADVLYSRYLLPEELNQAVNLDWVHVPTAFSDGLPYEQLQERGILVSQTPDERPEDVGLFVLASVLAFSKNLFGWNERSVQGRALSNTGLAESMQSIGQQAFLQIGLGEMGGQIARRAQQAGYRVIGVTRKYSFHPFCHQVIALDDLDRVLPQADVVSFCVGREDVSSVFLDSTKFAGIKEGCIFIAVSTVKNIDLEALYDIAKKGRFRGVLLDLILNAPLPLSPLWSLPGLILTPGVAACPRTGERLAFKQFLYNFRQFALENYRDMRNLVSRKVLASLRRTR